MFVVNVDIRVKAESNSTLEQTFRSNFYPAISRQQGFSSAELLRPLEAGSDYFLSLVFDQQASQERWVATDLHQQVWSQMESHFEDYVVTKYTTVER
jgi:heme-degrading monooxygenase HmoA